MRLYLFYTMVQKSQKRPKTQIKGGPALNPIFLSIMCDTLIFTDLVEAQTPHRLKNAEVYS